MPRAQVVVMLLLAVVLVPVHAQRAERPDRPQHPWMNTALSPEQRAELVLAEMTLDEKISLVHGLSAPRGTAPDAATAAVLARSNGGAGFAPGIARLGLPDLQLADAAVGVARGAARGRYSTPLPSTVALAAAWNLPLAHEFGALVGRELRDQGYNASLGAGVNLMREPRNGRNFEYMGADLPQPKLPGSDLTPQPVAPAPGAPAGARRRPSLPPFDITYPEGLKVGYKWFDAEHTTPLFPFGYGLSYTTFAYSGLSVTGRTVTFTVRNTGSRAGAETAQVYVALPPGAGEPPRRLVGWERIPLVPGESTTVSVEVDPLFLSVFDVQKHGWDLVPGAYTFFVGPSSRTLPLQASTTY